MRSRYIKRENDVYRTEYMQRRMKKTKKHQILQIFKSII